MTGVETDESTLIHTQGYDERRQFFESYVEVRSSPMNDAIINNLDELVAMSEALGERGKKYTGPVLEDLEGCVYQLRPHLKGDQPKLIALSYGLESPELQLSPWREKTVYWNLHSENPGSVGNVYIDEEYPGGIPFPLAVLSTGLKRVI